MSASPSPHPGPSLREGAAGRRRRKPVGVRPIYQTVVDAAGVLRRVGRPSLDKKHLREWVPFVRSAWHGWPTTVVHIADLLPDPVTP